MVQFEKYFHLFTFRSIHDERFVSTSTARPQKCLGREVEIVSHLPGEVPGEAAFYLLRGFALDIVSGFVFAKSMC